MRLFRMSLYSTWESITDPEERAKKAKELREKRKRIHDEYIKRTEPYTPENVLKESKRAFNKEITKGSKKNKKLATVKDIQEKAKFEKEQAMNNRNQEYDLIQDKPKRKSKFRMEQIKKTAAEEEAKAKKLKLKLLKGKIGKALKSKGAIAGYTVIGTAGLGYGAKKVYDHQKKKNANQEVQRKIWNGESKNTI